MDGSIDRIQIHSTARVVCNVLNCGIKIIKNRNKTKYDASLIQRNTTVVAACLIQLTH